MDWYEWTCPYCGARMDDPKNIRATTCDHGHTVFLGPPLANGARRAYKTAYERRKDQAELRDTRRFYSESFNLAKHRKKKA